MMSFFPRIIYQDPFHSSQPPEVPDVSFPPCNRDKRTCHLWLIPKPLIPRCEYKMRQGPSGAPLMTFFIFLAWPGPAMLACLTWPRLNCEGLHSLAPSPHVSTDSFRLAKVFSLPSQGYLTLLLLTGCQGNNSILPCSRGLEGRLFFPWEVRLWRAEDRPVETGVLSWSLVNFVSTK